MKKYRELQNTAEIFDTEINGIIPNDPTNMHRITYEKWLADGNTPDPYLPPLETPQMAWSGLQTRFANVQGLHTCKLNADGKKKITHNLNTLDYQVTTYGSLSVTLNKHNFIVSGGSAFQVISYEITLIQPESKSL